MKYIILCCLVFWSASGSLRAQAIHFEKNSLNQVFAKAKQQNKPVLVIIKPPLGAQGMAGLPLAAIASGRKTGLSTPGVAALLNKDFLVKEIALGTGEEQVLIAKFQVVSYPTYLYFDPEGNLLYRSLGESTNEVRYLQDLQAFRQAEADPHNLGYYQREFEKNNRAPEFLRQYLLKRRALGQWVEPDLLDIYAKQLPAKEFDRAREVVFILEFGPVLDSRAYQLTHLNEALLDSLYKSLPLAQRIQFNNLIINNTLAQAIATKNVRLAASGAAFARTSWLSNYQRGAQAYAYKMVTFYRGIKDTANYLRQAVGYYDRYYMGISTDSARRRVLVTMQARQAAAVPASTEGLPITYTMALNNAAWSVYQTGTRRHSYLQPAAQWSRRTIELDPAASHYDTLAHLLYRLQLYDEAVTTQRQAIARARTQKNELAAYEKELAKMRNRLL
jgi:hypothetical protein